ncbi:MAG: putative peptidase rane zinc metallopeptidase [Verrucomicrobiaceae bacterium]|nr:putative peptidase rane zinc metallopeptidase [Verrucomicrobiaceae bacterium]
MIWLLFFGTMALSGLASLLVRGAFSRYSKTPSSSGLTGAQAAQCILSNAGIRDVTILAQPGALTDHYDPSNRRLVLSEENFHGTSVAAIGIAAHESGHALQHQARYAPLELRMAAVGITNATGMIIPFIGMAGYFLSPRLALILMAGAMGIIMLFQLITLPVEFDATARAKRVVGELGLVGPGKQTAGMNRVIDAAALTYVAAFISAFLYFAYYLLQASGGRRD